MVLKEFVTKFFNCRNILRKLVKNDYRYHNYVRTTKDWRSLDFLFVNFENIQDVFLMTKFPASNTFKVNNRNTRTRREICSKLIIKTPERRHCSGVFIVNFEHFSRPVLVFLLLTLNIWLPVGSISLENVRRPMFFWYFQETIGMK